MIFTFVILHYKTDKDTIKCVNSIHEMENVENDNVNIVIVDNYSNNGSLERLEKKLSNKKDIYFLKNKKNLGFANGNNIGYLFAKNTLKSDFIIITNNDIIIKSKKVYKIIKEDYENYSFAVGGPDIVSLVDGGHQNPTIKTTTNIRLLRKEIFRYSVLFLLSKLGVYDQFRILKNKNEKSEIYEEPRKNDMVFNCQLHGSFLIFSPIFIKKEKIAFYDKTFLYCEEAILYDHCMKKKYILMYDPKMVVFHKEDSSTTFLNNNSSKKKREFVFKNVIKSHKVYVNYLNNPRSWE